MKYIIHSYNLTNSILTITSIHAAKDVPTMPNTNPATPLCKIRDLAPNMIAIIPQLSAMKLSAIPSEKIKNKNVIEVTVRDTAIIPNTIDAMDNPIFSCFIFTLLLVC